MRSKILLLWDNGSPWHFNGASTVAQIIFATPRPSKAKSFADRIHEQYLINLTRGKEVTVTNDDAKEIENYIATLRSDGVDVTKLIDLNTNEHHRSVVVVKKKAPFAQDTPALSYLEDGDWEDSQLNAAWAAKNDPDSSVKITT